MSSHLLLHNISFLSGTSVVAGMTLLVLVYALRTNRLLTTPIITFILMNVAVLIFQISQILGVNTSDPALSKDILMFNLTDIFIQIFMTHWFLSVNGKEKDQRYPLIAVYVTGLALFFYFIAFPNMFLVNSIPKLYFPSFYEPGPAYFIMPLWFFLVGIYYFYEMTVAYRQATDPIQRNRLKYVFVAIFYGFVVGTTDFLLVFNIPFDPLISGLFGLYTVPLTYAILRYDLLDIRILAKRSFYFALAVAAVSLCIALINGLSDYVVLTQPEIPKWPFYVLSSLIVASSGAYVWKKMREVDMMKYQFANVIAHTFRTPLTEIKWALEPLRAEAAKLSAQSADALQTIELGNSRLVELTNLLITLDDNAAKAYIYTFSDFPIGKIAKEVMEEYTHLFSVRHISFSFRDDSAGAIVHADEQKIKYVLRIIMENAIRYTGEKDSISLSITAGEKSVKITATDTGIGIPKAEAPLIFTKFYRAKNALRASTDGSGIGLYLAKEIVERSGGSISARSEGEGRGTTLAIILPRA